MAASRDVRRLLSILDQQGFGELAGEILSEIAAGRIDANKVSSVDVDDDRPAPRTPIPEEEQLAEAVKILRLRLIEPARKLAEAERIAGELGKSGPVRIAFVDSEGRELGKETNRAPGDEHVAAELDSLFSRILEARTAAR